jgi:hypothetical protein
MSLGSTRPLKDISTRHISLEVDKGGRCLGVKTLLLLCDDYQDILEVSTSRSPKDLYKDSSQALLQRKKPELLPDNRLLYVFMVQKTLISFLGSSFKI